jgi:hypothetical protein
VSQEVTKAERPSVKRTPLIGFAAVVLVLDLIHASHKDAAAGSTVQALLAVFTFSATLFLLGWGITWLARRNAGRLLATDAAEPPLLAGWRLSATRAAWLALFTAAAVVYAVGLAVVWKEAHKPYVTPGTYWGSFMEEGSFGLTWQEQARLGSLLEWPGWYPWLVVVRQALVFIAALAIAWSVFARRPRHWMAYLVAGFVALGPLLTLGGTQFTHTRVSNLAALLMLLGVLTTLGLLWMFPDGRFRGTYLRYLALVIITFAASSLLVGLGGGDIGDVVWNVGVLALLLFIGGGIAIQVWRYSHVPPNRKSLAHWNLVFLVAIPAWLLFYGWVYDRFERNGSRAAFAWHQIFLTIYLTGPVLFGLWVLYLMRSQGWWDAQRFWRRTTVFLILAPLFLAAYVGVLVAVTGIADVISGAKNQTLAVLIATAAVAFAFRPTQRVVAGWVDQRFFPSRKMADETVARFIDRVRQESDPDAVRDELLAVVREALGSGHAAVWVTEREMR